MITSKIIDIVKVILDSERRSRFLLFENLKRTPRYTSKSITLFGNELKILDSHSFLFMYKEIFEHQIYKFNAKKTTPLILDCGANIGLSTLYFKNLYPNSTVIAYEPDKTIFSALEFNINSFGVKDVFIENKAVWNADSHIEFMPEGADGGRIVEIKSSKELYSVPTVRLRNHLNRKVDLLKLDIEGSEFEVLKDCKDLLENVENLFVEYHSFINEKQRLNKILDFLYEAGFRVYIDQLRKIRQPFVTRKQCLGMDMILNIFAYR